MKILKFLIELTLIKFKQYFLGNVVVFRYTLNKTEFPICLSRLKYILAIVSKPICLIFYII